MGKRALVLGGGGVAAAAWELGVLAALAEAGVDVPSADLVVGTSAGALVGAQLAGGADVRRLYEEQLAGTDPPAARLPGRAMLALSWMLLRHRDPLRYRRQVGRFALAAATVPEADRRRDIASRLGADAWPRQPLKITAVDAATGALVTFTDGDQVPLVDAVTASTAVPGIQPPATIRGRRYIDGGIRSCANADLAAGYGRIVVLAPVARGSGPVAGVASQVRALHGRYRVALVTPDRTARRAMGVNPSDPSRRPGAARAGYAQGRVLAPGVRDVWFSSAGAITAPGA